MKRVNLTNYGDRRILLTELVLVLILVVLTVFLLGSVNDIQGTAKVVNYTGIVRGGTQRLVKLELCGQPNDELLEELDAIIEELYHGGGKHNFAQLDSQEYKDQLYAIDHYWHGLREEILYARKNAGEQSELLSMSETYFDMTNTLVEKAEQFSQEEATQIRWMEFLYSLTLPQYFSFWQNRPSKR